MSPERQRNKRRKKTARANNDAKPTAREREIELVGREANAAELKFDEERKQSVFYIKQIQ